MVPKERLAATKDVPIRSGVMEYVVDMAQRERLVDMKDVAT